MPEQSHRFVSGCVTPRAAVVTPIDLPARKGSLCLPYSGMAIVVITEIMPVGVVRQASAGADCQIMYFVISV